MKVFKDDWQEKGYDKKDTIVIHYILIKEDFIVVFELKSNIVKETIKDMKEDIFKDKAIETTCVIKDSNYDSFVKAKEINVIQDVTINNSYKKDVVEDVI